MLPDERINLPKEKRSDSGEGDCAARDENSVLFEERPARLPFVNQRPALKVFLKRRVEVSLFHVGSRKRKSPAEARLSTRNFFNSEAHSISGLIYPYICF